jgi:hypothetical protein
MTETTLEVSEQNEERVERSECEWSTPSIDEQSACAEICAYVFTE